MGDTRRVAWTWPERQAASAARGASGPGQSVSRSVGRPAQCLMPAVPELDVPACLCRPPTSASCPSVAIAQAAPQVCFISFYFVRRSRTSPDQTRCSPSGSSALAECML